MPVLAGVVAVAVILLVLIDGFEAIMLPRRVSSRLRPTRVFYTYLWKPWAAIGRRMKTGKRREFFLGVFGPLSMLLLLTTWAVALVVGFGVLHWALDTRVRSDGGSSPLLTYLYLSGSTFTTLGFGDVTPRNTAGRVVAVLESGLGFAFLAMVIGYLPVLYQAFSRREAQISRLDARAGSPPSAAQILLRHPPGELEDLLADWERWAAELLESQISFPVLSYYRSQHDNQSWLAALTAILDTSALMLSVVDRSKAFRPQVTFAASRHAVVDIALIFRTAPWENHPERLAYEKLGDLRTRLTAAGLACGDSASCGKRFDELRRLYEPFLFALADYFLLNLPPILPEEDHPDNWQTSAWTRRTPGLKKLAENEHFD